MKLSFAKPVKGWAEADLMERPLGDYRSSAVITRELRPFEIVSFRVKI
jgi:hypothetical protein